MAPDGLHRAVRRGRHLGQQQHHNQNQQQAAVDPSDAQGSGGVMDETNQLELMQSVLQETLQELQSARTQQQGEGGMSSDIQEETSRDSNSIVKLPRGAALGVPRVHEVDEEGEGGPNDSPWGRRALGDNWYDARCIRCSVCTRPIMASTKQKRGQRCAGCLRWFHDSCAPAATLPLDKAKRECDPNIGGYYHCSQCATVHQRLREGAQALNCKQLSGGCHVSLIDLHALRQSRKPGPYTHTLDRRMGEEENQDSTAARTAKPFQRIARTDLKMLKQLGPQYMAKAPAGASEELERQQSPESAGSATSAQGDSLVVAAGSQSMPSVRVNMPKRGGLSDLKSIVRIFKTYHKDESESDVMEDSWAAVMKCGGTPVTAASLLVMGDDHARIQGLVTEPAARRQGHARVLVQELGAWLGSAGVPRMVVVLPERPAGPRGKSDDQGEGVLSKLRFKRLQDLELLGHWKQEFFQYYTRELIGMRPRVLIRELNVAKR